MKIILSATNKERVRNGTNAHDNFRPEVGTSWPTLNVVKFQKLSKKGEHIAEIEA
jgi:hypothetical protein